MNKEIVFKRNESLLLTREAGPLPASHAKPSGGSSMAPSLER
jgi:hypothetical protein